jgi:hypothetical protein
MAIQYHCDLYPRDDPKDGARLVRFTKLQSAEYRGEANGTGSGRFSIRADTAEAQFIDPLGLQYVRVVREDTVAVTEAVVGGFFLDTGDFAALDERGTRLLTFGGAGTLSYLARAIMWSHTYISAAGYVGQDPFDQIWRLDAQWDTLGISGDVATGPSLGGMLWRAIYEAQHFTPGVHKHGDTPAGESVSDTHDDDRTENPLPALTTSFDWTRDTNGNLFALFDAEFRPQVGDNLLAVVKRLMEAGLYVSMDPDTFVLNAYPAATHRRSRIGASWGTNVVRFQAPTGGDITTGNIKSDALRAITAHIKRSALLAGGQDIYGLSTGSTDIPWEGFYPSDAAAATALENIATVQLGARDDAGDTLRLRGRLGTTPSTGHYLPFETAGVLLDDLATVHSGATQWDYNEQTFPVAAATVILRPGGDWDVFYDLGSSYSSMAERRFQVSSTPSHTHPPNPQLCRAGDPAEVLYGPLDFSAGAQTVAVYPSGTDTWPLNSVLAGTDGNPPGPAGTTGKVGWGGTAASTDPNSPPLPATAGGTYNWSAWAWASASVHDDPMDILRVSFYEDGEGVPLATHDLAVDVPQEGWLHYSGSFTAPTGTDFMVLEVDGYGLGTNNAYNLVTVTGLGGSVGDGHPLLIGTGPRAKRCSDTEHFFATRPPGADDDFATMGMRRGTHWVWVDDIDNPTESFGSWVAHSVATGAAVWIELGAGTAAAATATPRTFAFFIS